VGGRRTAPLGRSTPQTAGVERKPFGPVPAQLEKIVKVDETALLEIINKARKHIVRWQRSESNQPVLNAKFFVGKIVSLIQGISGETDPLKRALADEYHGAIVQQFQGHE